jgi:hypothetical protein
MTLLGEALDCKITIRENGGSRRVTAREAIVMRTVSDALKGDHKSRALLLEYEPKILHADQLRQERDFDDLPREEKQRRAAETYLKLVRGDGS